MKYVSAEWVHNETLNEYTIKAIGDDGNEYWLSDPNSDVPPWPQYLAEGGTISGEGPPQAEPA